MYFWDENNVMPINSMHIITGLDIGGAETMLFKLVKDSPESYRSTIVISLTTKGVIGQRLEKIGITVIELEMRNKISFFCKFLKLKKIIKSKRPKIIHTWMYHANLIGGLAAYIANNRNIIWSIRRSELKLNESLTTYLVMKLGALFSEIVPKKIVCVAKSGLKNHESYGYNRKKMIVIPNGFDSEKLKHDEVKRKAIRNSLDINNEQLVIGSVGRFHESKDFKNLVMSATKVIPQYRNVKYMMVGRNLDSKNPILMKWINQTGYRDYFSLIGETDDIAGYMSAMDIFCLSSKTEGFPNVIGEALSMKLPCVVTNVGDVGKIVGKNAIIVTPENRELLCNGLCDMLSMNEEKRIELGLRGRKKIKRGYSLKSVHEKYCDLYASVIK